MIANPAIVWIREDCRLGDNPALHLASRHAKVLPVYILEKRTDWPIGGAKKWWLHKSLKSFQKQLEEENLSLAIFEGDPWPIFERLLSQFPGAAVYWNRRYDPEGVAVDTAVKARLKDHGADVQSCPGNLLNEPWTNVKDDGSPYQVYTPYWKRFIANKSKIITPLAKVTFQSSQRVTVDSLAAEDLCLLPKINWHQGIERTWSPGEKAALEKLQSFIEEKTLAYNDTRDFPAVLGTSQLSPYLANGELTPRQIWAAIENTFGDLGKVSDKSIVQYAKEIVWREFAYHLIFHFPHTTTQPLREAFKKFPWCEDQVKLESWQEGKTGYPIVDAGMRELWQTGWMHNRVRMIVASFLVKHLRLHWLSGARWFWDTLVDADLASNTLGWQWAAGCGADAAPYFRIFNPIIQGEKFDASGKYTLRFCPELADVAKKHLFKPWEATPVPRAYPAPVVIHTKARIQALEAYEKVKS